MTSAFSQRANLTIRPFQYRDLEAIEHIAAEGLEAESRDCDANLSEQLQQIRRWYGPLKFLSFFPNPLQHLLCMYVGEQGDVIQGAIQVSPFNRTRSTWRADRILVGGGAAGNGQGSFSHEIASQLLRHCFEKIWEARTWLIELEVNDKGALSLYRQNGFQPLAQNTYWAIAPDTIQQLATREPDLPNLRPVSNTDASLLHQLDTASMPPLVRQVFDRHVVDFKTGLPGIAVKGIKRWMNRTEVIERYVFEPQRKAAIGYFCLQLCADGTQPHSAQLTVHPAYTWLYPELLAQMAIAMKPLASQGLRLVSSDYQPEREEYFEQIGATRTEHTLLMSRSVWHKLREAKPVSLEALQLSEVLQGFQPSRKPVPGRFALPSPFSSPSPYRQLPSKTSPLSPPDSVSTDGHRSEENDDEGDRQQSPDA
ncbi:MAG: N-acetyltransferase family protein [Elainellaceae cyanobacterium]